MYVYVRMSEHVTEPACTHGRLYTRVHLCICVCAWMSVHVGIYVHVLASVCKSTCNHARLFVHRCVQSRTYLYTCETARGRCLCAGVARKNMYGLIRVGVCACALMCASAWRVRARVFVRQGGSFPHLRKLHQGVLENFMYCSKRKSPF